MLEEEFGRAKLILGIGVVMFAIGQSLLFVIVAPVARSVGLSEVQFGWAFTIGNLGLVAGSMIWGAKSDAVGRKPIFVLGMAGGTFGILLLALTLKAGEMGLLAGWGLFVVLALSRATYGMLASAIYPVATAYMADITPPKDRATGHGHYRRSQRHWLRVGPGDGWRVGHRECIVPVVRRGGDVWSRVPLGHILSSRAG